MHIPDGFVSGPINLGGWLVATGTVLVAARRAEKRLDERQLPLMGVTAAFIFAAQMLNFPIAAGTSGHFLGAALATRLLGAPRATLVMAVVLVVQCLMFADGGLTALGTNIINMGVIGVAVAALVFALADRLLPATRGARLAAAAGAAWLSVVVAATACSLELAGSGSAPLALVLPAMAGVHAVIGIGEALITVALLGMVEASRPDLLPALAEEWS